ncbi:MAG: alpha/beta hydrolase [Polyangiaceae bacterium]|jgi:hypothetical protein|nr:alpha/beta hydrolase [Polyangiaceae bacterium]
MSGFKLRRRWVAPIVLIIALALSLLGVPMFFENHFIYCPTRTLEDTPAAYGLAFEDVWARAADGTRIHGWAMIPADRPVAWLLFSHGNAGNISGRPVVARPLVQRGLAVLLYDYRGYGLSEGAPDEPGTYLDGEAMLAEVLRRAPHSSQVFLFGRSLGGAISYELAVRHPNLGGVITDATFTSMPELARRLFAIPGLGHLVRTRYDNLQKAGRTSLPRLVMHGTHDEMIPFEMAQALRDATHPPAAFFAVQGATHNDTFLVGGDEYANVIERFVLGCLRSGDRR